jgi:hypothetical protein
MNHHSLADSIIFVEDLSGQKLTPEEVEELRRLLEDIARSKAEDA